MKREKLETYLAIGALILMALAALGLYAAAHHHQVPAAAILVDARQSESHSVTPSKDTTALAPGIVAAPRSPSPVPRPTPPASLAVLGAEWCGPCKRLEREVLPDLSDLDIKLIDVNKEADLAARLYSPRTHAIPQFVLIDGSDNPLAWLIGYQSATDVRTFLADREHPKAKTPGPESPGVTHACQPVQAGPLRRLFPRR